MLAWAGAGVAGLAGVAGFLHLALRKRTRSGGHLAFGPAGMAKRRKQADEGNGSAFLPVAGKALPPCPAGPSASQSKEEMSFPLLQLVGQPLMLDICKHLSAKDIARLQSCSRQLLVSLNGEEAARWVVQSRDWNHLESIHRMGDLTLKIPSDCWTLERLHLAEDPPRFGQMQFDFARHELDVDGAFETVNCLEHVARLMMRHKGIRLRVTGYTQPDAPGFIALKISAARAAMVSLYLACRLSGLAVNSRNLRIARLALDGQPHIYVLNQRLMLWADATWGSIGMFNGIMGALYGSSDESDSSSEEEEDEDEEDDEAEVELGLEEAGPEHEEVEGEGEEEGGGGQGPQAAAPSGVPPQPLPSVAVGHSHAERSKQVLIQAPLEWSLAEPSRELPGLDPSGLSLHAMTCMELRGRLMEVLSRIEQRAGGGSSPSNANWNQEPSANLSVDRRAEFTLLSI